MLGYFNHGMGHIFPGCNRVGPGSGQMINIWVMESVGQKPCQKDSRGVIFVTLHSTKLFLEIFKHISANVQLFMEYWHFYLEVLVKTAVMYNDSNCHK